MLKCERSNHAGPSLIYLLVAQALVMLQEKNIRYYWVGQKSSPGFLKLPISLCKDLQQIDVTCRLQTLPRPVMQSIQGLCIPKKARSQHSQADLVFEKPMMANAFLDSIPVEQ